MKCLIFNIPTFQAEAGVNIQDRHALIEAINVRLSNPVFLQHNSILNTHHQSLQFVMKKYSASKLTISLLNLTIKAKTLNTNQMEFLEYLPYLWSYTHLSRGILFCDKL